MKRTIALCLTALSAFVLSAAAPGPSAAPDDHQIALSALADIDAARAEIVHIEDDFSTVGHPAFVHVAQRALNAVVGKSDKNYKPDDGDPGDGVGAIGHIDQLLDRQNDSLWTPAMQGAKANLLAVVVDLHDAMSEKQMEDYQTDLTEALANFALAVGRPSEEGVLGGIDGALGTTSLAVPANAPSVSGCTLPSHVDAPTYGVARGHLAFVALPKNNAAILPVQLTVTRVVVSGNAVVLYTPEAHAVASLCKVHLDRARAVRETAVAPVKLVANAGSETKAPYTLAQAHDGATVFASKCVSCHGANLQGVAAPGVAGTEFLNTVKGNKWSLEDLRTLVFENMPLSNPGSLTPKEYAAVMAYLLASNCYPAGSQPFPEKDTPSFASIKLGPVADAKPTDTKLGTCAIK